MTSIRSSSLATIDQADGELLIASPAPLQFLNAVMRERRDEETEDGGGDATGLLDRARKFFFERGRGFVVYTWPGDPELERAALAAYPTSLGAATDITAVPDDPATTAFVDAVEAVVRASPT